MPKLTNYQYSIPRTTSVLAHNLVWQVAPTIDRLAQLSLKTWIWRLYLYMAAVAIQTRRQT